MRQHLSQYYKVIEQNSLPIPHSIVRELKIDDYKRTEALGFHYGDQELLHFYAFRERHVL
jgi:hypothetical protein